MANSQTMLRGMSAEGRADVSDIFKILACDNLVLK
jgi:hypothetical protein